jgi:hypothetical protein
MSLRSSGLRLLANKDKVELNQVGLLAVWPRHFPHDAIGVAKTLALFPREANYARVQGLQGRE